MERKYLIETSDYLNAPNKGTYIVYAIQVGQLAYIGATQNARQRFGSHAAAFEKAIRAGRIGITFAGAYPRLELAELVRHGYRFGIVETCETLEALKLAEISHQRQHEPNLINKTTAATYGKPDRPKRITARDRVERKAQWLADNRK